MGSETVEIITGRERRRRWSVADKLRILAECDEPGAQVSAVAARHGIYRSLVFQWRRQARDGLLVAEPVPGFVPVRLEAPEPPSAVEGPSEAPSAAVAAPARRASSPSRPPAVIEIELPDGVRLRVGEEVGATALRRVLAALRG
jgi:transposase